MTTIFTPGTIVQSKPHPGRWMTVADCDLDCYGRIWCEYPSEGSSTPSSSSFDPDNLETVEQAAAREQAEFDRRVLDVLARHAEVPVVVEIVRSALVVARGPARAGSSPDSGWRASAGYGTCPPGERAQCVAVLRRICAEYGDNDWPDDLHLADVLEKHLERPLRELLP